MPHPIKSMVYALACLAGAGAPAAAQDFKPETVSAVPSIPEGPYLLAHSGFGAGAIAVIDPEAFRYMGGISTGTAAGVWWGQALAVPGGKEVYVSKTYYSHGTDGTRTDTIERWSVPALAPLAETPLTVAKQAMRSADRALFSQSSDGRWLYLQNATPATSITVFDTATQTTAGEIPLAGCWGAYPVLGAARLAVLCGDGRLSTVSLDAEGRSSGLERSEKIFDVDSDPLFTDYQRSGNELLMVSFNGNFYRIDISGSRARLVEKRSLVEGVEGDWRPSSTQPLAYVPESRVLYVLMRLAKGNHHSYDKPADEVWAFDLQHRKLLSRSSVQDATGLVYFKGSVPMLFAGAKDVGLVRYVIDPAAGYTVRKDRTMKLPGAGALKVAQ